MFDKKMSLAWDISKKRVVYAREIAQEKNSMGEAAFRAKRSEDFRCTGCRDLLQEQGKPLDELTQIQFHFEKGNRHNGGFRLWKGYSHKSGCRFINPYNHVVALAKNRYGLSVGKRGAIRLQILPSTSDKNENKERAGSAQSSKSLGKVQPRASTARFFEYIYTKLGEANREEIPIETEDGQTTTLEKLWITADVAHHVQNNQFVFLEGQIQSVKTAGDELNPWINLYFKMSRNQGIVKLTLYPDTIYTPQQLECYKNRKIGCYGKLKRSSHRGCQIFLYSPENQIALLDRQPGEVLYLRPSLDLNRAWSMCERSMVILEAQEVKASPLIQDDWYGQINNDRKVKAIRQHKERQKAEKKQADKKLVELMVEKEEYGIKLDESTKDLKKTQEILNKLQSKGIIGRWKKRREIKENQDRLEVLEEEIAYLKERLSEKKVKYEQASIKAHQQSQKVSEIEDTERWYQRVEEWVRQGKGEEELWSTVLDNPGWRFFEIPGTDWSTIIAVRLTTGDPEQPPELQNETQLTAQAYCQLIHPKTRIISPATETKSCSLSSLIDRMQPYSIVNPKLRYTLHSEIEKSLKSLYKPPKESLTWLKNQTKKDKLPITTTSG